MTFADQWRVWFYPLPLSFCRHWPPPHVHACFSCKFAVYVTPMGSFFKLCTALVQVATSDAATPWIWLLGTSGINGYLRLITCRLPGRLWKWLLRSKVLCTHSFLGVLLSRLLWQRLIGKTAKTEKQVGRTRQIATPFKEQHDCSLIWHWSTSDNIAQLTQ